MTDWSELGGLTALAPHTGPFPHPDFLRTWWSHRGRGELLQVRVGAGALAIVVDGEVATLAGEADLTDYHSPLGGDLGEVATAVVAVVSPGCRLVFDSLPIEAAEEMLKHFSTAGVALTMSEHANTMVLNLPEDPAAYLETLEAKQRHELRRKRRRFQEQVGIPALRRDQGAIGDFVAMHRGAPGDKGEFMTAEMEAFFGSLVDDAGAVIDVLVDGAGHSIGAAFGFEDDDTYYLYNSAFDPECAALSPGIVLVTSLIDSVITSGRKRVDFLKGGEDYKSRLGARARPLYVLEGVT
ncbi:MAG: GNAT family N-acetyltransferase [Actinomycetota bacterium]